MLSLDIENGKLRCAQGKSRAGAAVVSGYFEVEFPEEVSLLSEGAPEKLGEILAKELRERHVRDKKCTVSLRSPDLFFRRVTLPKAGSAQVKDMVSHALSGILTAKDYYVDYTVEREYVENGKKKLDVLLCGAPKILSKAYYSMLLAANLFPHRMDAQQNLIHRLLLQNSAINGVTLRNQAVLLIDAGNSVISSDLIVEGRSVFERTINAKARRGPLDIYDSYDGPGAPNEGGMGRVYAKIQDEAGKMLQFSLTKTVDKAVSQIFLYGENSADLELLESLPDLGVAVQPIREVTGIKLAKGYDGPDVCKICGLLAALL